MTRDSGRRLLRAGAGIATVVGVVALLHQSASAEGPRTPAAAQTTVGPLPLMAALAIGIALAVGAVVAFLQMTAKGRREQSAAPAGWQLADNAQADAEAAAELMPADYTVPLQRTVAAEPVSSDAADQGEPRLCGVEGQFAGACFRLGRGLSIGRDPAMCSVVFPVAVGEVSRRHCTLQFEAGRRLFLLEDHGSSNGTFLPGGERLEPGKRYELRSGERFALSGTLHWFEVRV